MRASFRFLVFGLLFVLGGCLEVESLEVTVVSDAKHDRLDLMVVSRGIWSSSTIEANLKNDLANLHRCRDVSALIAPGLGIIDFTDNLKEGEGWKRSIEFVSIEPGAFFLDEQGRLSFYQFVRIDRLSEFLRLVNEEAPKEWREQADEMSRETRECVEAAIRDGLIPIVIDGAAIRIRIPMSEDDHRKSQEFLWRSLVRGVEKAVKKNGSGTSALERGVAQAFRDNDVAIVRYVNYTEWVCGVQGAETCEYSLRSDPYQDNLLELFTEDEPPPPKVTQALIDRQFAVFRGREPRLPKPYAEARKLFLEEKAKSDGGKR